MKKNQNIQRNKIYKLLSEKMKINSKKISRFLLNYESYWKFELLCLIMKHCQRAKHGVPTIRLMKHVEKGNYFVQNCKKFVAEATR